MTCNQFEAELTYIKNKAAGVGTNGNYFFAEFHINEKEF